MTAQNPADWSGKINESILATCAAATPEIWHCFGVEARASYLLDQRGRLPGTVKAYYRPPSEPVLASFWPKLRSLNVSPNDALDLASLLTGKRQKARTKPMRGADEQGRPFKFAPKVDGRGLYSFVQSQDDDLETALTNIFVCTIYEHPFTDGNGRLTRALMQGVLGQRGLITFPCLPLNSVFHARANEIGAALRLAVSTGNSIILQAALCRAINEAAALALEVLGPAHLPSERGR